MPETIKEHDFIELDYTGKLADGTIFDTTLEKVAKENNLFSEKRKYLPTTICVGEKQVLPGLDDELIGKDIGKEYAVTLPPEKAFGKRDIKKMRIVPTNSFKEHKVEPHPGLQVDIDGEMGIISRVSGGRTIVNFNHPLSGKEVTYTFKINKRIEEPKDKLISYITMSLGIPKEMIKAEVKENKAEVKLPFELPAQVTDLLANKLSELVKLETTFSKEEAKKDTEK
ncbi:MAG: peptidylprolyl isomerase [Nanoarchaeota archaeon]|nr:peptidylprolyl isomerase [Nanoarchaeota archaeon]MBU1632461.1 peptidylprolyl isomerase [Nanoarchaeota archaeon]MBU1876466.1 peptidylprolyl isomerase [Nanoarchaeota archaeon]